MSAPDFPLTPAGDPSRGVAAARPPGAGRPPSDSIDAALDRALRDVPLPDGLLTRLGEIVYRASDDPADRLDWLGC